MLVISVLITTVLVRGLLADLAVLNATESSGSIDNSLDASEEEITAIDGSVITLSCPDDNFLEITGAILRPFESLKYTSNCSYTFPVFAVLKQLCNGKHDCEMAVPEKYSNIDSDVCRGIRTAMMVRYKCFAEYIETKHIVCEGEAAQLNCSEFPDYPLISVTWAFFGRYDWTTCPRGILLTGNCGIDVTERYQEGCNGQKTCGIKATNDNFGNDPCFGTSKYFTLKYRCYRDTPENYAKLHPKPATTTST